MGNIMRYRIVVDSCCELPVQYKNDDRFTSVPLELQVGNERIRDDETFNQREYLAKVAACPECARSACPDPETYMKAYSIETERVYVITLSSKLSGSYNSALLAADLYEEEMAEEYGSRKIHVIDSKSASAAETQIALKLIELEDQGLSFEEIVEKIEAFRDSIGTYFVINNLDTFIKNGRIKGIKAAVATTLSVKPILAGNEGEIVQLGQALGMKKAINKMVEIILSNKISLAGRRIIISECNCPDRAKSVADMLTASLDLEVMILSMAGVSTTYANDGGVIVTL